MPTIIVHMTPGRNDDQKRQIVKEITEVFVRLGVPARGVTVILNEVPGMHYALEGEPVADKFKSAEDVNRYFGVR